MYDFGYQKVTSLEDAARLLAEDEDALVLAGGQTLLPTLKQRLAQPSKVLDLSGISGLNTISEEGESLWIEALCRHCDLERSSLLHHHIPALAALAGMIGDAQVRNRGTLGGSLANNDPAADYPAAILALKGIIKTHKRTIPAEDFFVDLFTTALEEGELIQAVQISRPKKAAYQKRPNPASRYAIVGVFIALFEDAVHVAVTGAGPCAFRVPEMEAALTQNFHPDALKGLSLPSETFHDDIHASKAYRAHLIAVLAQRAVTEML